MTREGKKEIMRKVAEALSGLNVGFIHLDPGELHKVYDIAKRYGLDFEDAIHYYCSLSVNAEMISNDSDLKKLGTKF
ncbi:type II toxin-antitoxin system VapC family toxin [Metallosphaera hakonensis]|uniref:type II toxin-antitoxin system VapC family toxin n=1 Tax=Metallosphaera hakonensis TaxID=79601 RepID=UPI001F0FFCC6|nr:PIN domain-containing protein [Metallosphaera hakonensis]